MRPQASCSVAPGGELAPLLSEQGAPSPLSQGCGLGTPGDMRQQAPCTGGQGGDAPGLGTDG